MDAILPADLGIPKGSGTKKTKTHPAPTLPEPNAVNLPTKKSGNTTASLAAQILIRKQLGFMLPTTKQKRHLVIAFAKRDMIVYGKAFDILRLSKPINLDSLEDIETHLDLITLYEIKSTNQSFNDAFDGYFFGLTTAEVLVSQSLRERFKFVFVNTLSGSHLEMALSQVFAKARGIYPTWSISF